MSPCSILSAPATAELEPLADGQVSQMDEVMMVDVSPLLTGSFCQKEPDLAAPGPWLSQADRITDLRHSDLACSLWLGRRKGEIMWVRGTVRRAAIGNISE